MGRWKGENLRSVLVPVFYPSESMPPDDVPVNTVELFAPMSLETYYESPLIVEWVKDFYP